MTERERQTHDGRPDIERPESTTNGRRTNEQLERKGDVPFNERLETPIQWPPSPDDGDNT